MPLVAACLTAWFILLGGRAAAATSAPPPWAYPIDPPDMPEGPSDDGVVHVPQSNRTYLSSQLEDLFSVADWHPEDHPSMPDVVARGRKPAVYACAYCHLPDGGGRPENASLAGLPADYIVQQLADMRSGVRRTSVPERVPPQFMIALARSLDDADAQAAAQYFSRLPPQFRISVVETNTVPHTHVAGWFLAADSDAPREPIGQRIIEVPQSLEQFEHRDARSRFIAYVPLGSVKTGEALIKSGGLNRTVACGGCHGADLAGAGIVPSIAGRSPSYIVRQLYDMKSGTRAGTAAAPMRSVVEHLEVEDMIAIAAYLATLH